MSVAPPAPQWRYKWSIAFLHGPHPLALAPLDARGRPGLTARAVTDIRAVAVADPFLIRTGDGLFLFFEALNADSGRGELAFATSADGQSWAYGGVILREPFHLSYPQVFSWDGAWYMIPETRQAGEVRLYRARAFPGGWDVVATLLRGPFADSTIHHDGRTWWLFAQRGLDEMRLYGAETPLGPWREHPASPLWPGNRSRTRPGGRLLSFDGRLIRLAQDGWPAYGAALRAFEIDRLDHQGYAEHEIGQSPLLRASRSGWNAMAMHHMDVVWRDDGTCLAAVDGATLALC